jgi:hypothetical protein
MRVPGSPVRRVLRAVLVMVAVALVLPVLVALPAAPAEVRPPLGQPPIIGGLVGATDGVRVEWVDRSDREDVFEVYRRGSTGSWEPFRTVPTPDRAGIGRRSSVVDPSPNAVGCYIVVIHDRHSSFEPAWSREECVGGGLDPFDPTVSPVGPRLAAPGLTSVRVTGEQASGRSLTISWTDRSLTENRFRVVRRQGAVTRVVADRLSAGRTSVGKVYSHVDVVPADAVACYTVHAVADDTPSGNQSNELCIRQPTTLPAPRGPATAGRSSAAPVYTGSAGGVGDSSVAVGADGLPVISLRGGSPANPSVTTLVVTHCDDPACGTATSTELDTGGSLSSIEIGRDGLAVVSHVSPGGDLRVVHCSNRACTSATVTTLVTEVTVGTKTDVSIGSDGLPTIAYEDVSRPGVSVLKVAHCRDVACTGASVTAVDTVPANLVGRRRLSIATSPVTGYTYLAFVGGATGGADATGNVLKVTACLDPACTRRSTHPVDRALPGESRTGTDVSLAIGRDDLPLLSYRAHDDLVVAHCVNVACSGVTTKLVDNPGIVAYSSLAIGRDGLGVVGYYDLGNNRLKVAHCADPACGDASTVTIPASRVFDPSIAIGADGLPLIGSDDESSVSVVRCADETCSGAGAAGPHAL